MKLRLILAGQRFRVFGLDLADEPARSDCPAIAFLATLEATDPASFKALAQVVERHANHGPVLNEEKSRLLEDGIYEFKSPQGARLLWFYDEGQQTILTHGFKKGAKLKPEVKRARRLRDEWKERMK